MLKVAVTGLGFMGRMHYNCYKALEEVEIVSAVCEVDQSKPTNSSEAIGNIGAEESLDLTGIKLFYDFDKMLAEVDLDAISIALPTYMHCDKTIKALQAGVHVLCEKPMALTIAECEKMIDAAEKSGKVLQIGHCIRFWPEYANAKQIIDSGKYGKVLTATFQRLSLTPTWGWDGWILDGKRSGGASFDLHIHDTDFVQYLFGMPKAVRSFGVKGPSSDYDHIITNYIYEDDKMVTAEGSWMMAASFGFEMSFNIVMEKATITFDCTRQPAFKVCPVDSEAFTPQVEPGDGYSREIAHFVKAAQGQKVSEILTPHQSLDSVKLVNAEKQSIAIGADVQIA